MSILKRLFGERRVVRVVEHLEPFDFRGIDLFSITEEHIGAIAAIPFLCGSVKESVEPYDAKRHFTMDGRVPDLVHRFIRPPRDGEAAGGSGHQVPGVPIEFLFLNDVLIQVSDRATAYR